MENNQYSFNLFDIIRTVLKWKTYIIGLAIAASLAAAVYLYMQKNEYKAYGSFFPASAVMSGRINLFRENQQEWIDFFGGENEVDRAFVIGNSADVVSYLIDKYDFAKHYNIDVKNDPDGSKKVYKRFAKNFSLSRSGYKHLEVSFVDEDADLAHKVVNEAMNRTEDMLRKLYEHVNTQLAAAIDNRKDSISDQLKIYTDSLIQLRVKYNIYDIVSPGRSNLITGNAKGSHALGQFARRHAAQAGQRVDHRLLAAHQLGRTRVRAEFALATEPGHHHACGKAQHDIEQDGGDEVSHAGAAVLLIVFAQKAIHRVGDNATEENHKSVHHALD